MTALTADRDTPQRSGERRVLPMKAAVVIYAGSMVALDTTTGYVGPGATSTTLRCLGIAPDQFNNATGAAGAATAEAKRGTFRLANSAGADQITTKDIGASAYMVDDQTVAKTDGTTTRSIAGVVADVDDQGVWVTF